MVSAFMTGTPDLYPCPHVPSKQLRARFTFGRVLEIHGLLSSYPILCFLFLLFLVLFFFSVHSFKSIDSFFFLHSIFYFCRTASELTHSISVL